jgi:hypothetical protein
MNKLPEIGLAFIGASALLWTYHSFGLAFASFCLVTAIIMAGTERY